MGRFIHAHDGPKMCLGQLAKPDAREAAEVEEVCVSE